MKDEKKIKRNKFFLNAIIFTSLFGFMFCIVSAMGSILTIISLKEDLGLNIFKFLICSLFAVLFYKLGKHYEKEIKEELKELEEKKK